MEIKLIKETSILPIQIWLQDVVHYLIRPIEIFREYDRNDLYADFIAGMTVAIVMLPQAIAYALIAELPAETGLYAAILATTIGAIWGSSVHLSTGPTNAASLLVLSTLLPIVAVGTPEYLAAAALMAIMVGIIRLVMGLAKLGVLVNFVSDSVIIGFTAGAGILISANQLRHLLNLPIESMPEFYTTVPAIISHIHETHLLSFAIGLGTIIAIVLIKKFVKFLPGPLISMIVASIIVGVLGLDEQGVKVLGSLPRTFPPLAFELPDAVYTAIPILPRPQFIVPITDWALMKKMFTGALAVSAIGLVEAMSIARAIASQSGQRLDSNQEFVGQGLSNIAAGIFSGYTCSGSFTRSAVNFTSGARTALSSIFASIFVLAALLAFASYASYLPRAALAGVLIVTAYGMVERDKMKRIWQSSLGDTSIMIATIIATLVLPLEFAVLAGIIVSVIRFLVKTSQPKVFPVVPDQNFRHFTDARDTVSCPQLGIISISGPLYFGASQYVEDTIRTNLQANPGQHLLLLRMHLVDHCDVSGITMLESIVRMYRKQRGDVYITGPHKRLMEEMKRNGLDKFLGDAHIIPRHDIISYMFHNVVEPSICIYECPHRVFAECQALPKKQDIALKDGKSIKIPEHHISICLPSTLKEQIDNQEEIELIDIREPSEFQKARIPQSKSYPISLMREEEIPFPKNRPIVLACRIGRRSRLAACILQDRGYNNICVLHGGILAWEAAGYPLAVE